MYCNEACCDTRLSKDFPEVIDDPSKDHSLVLTLQFNFIAFSRDLFRSVEKDLLGIIVGR